LNTFEEVYIYPLYIILIYIVLAIAKRWDIVKRVFTWSKSENE